MGIIIRNILNEATRGQLIDKSKKGANYKDQSKGKNRWERRTKSNISSSVAQYNKFNADDFFKKDSLKIGIQVIGETDTYTVSVRLEGALKEIAQLVQSNDMKLEFKTILIAVTRKFNSNDIYVSCNCPDFKYRFAYNSNKNGYDASAIPELRPNRFDWTNKNDNMGAGCKHINLVLSNVDWIYKISSVILNYIYYCRDNMEYNYARYIFPKIYGMEYDKAVQLSLFDDDTLTSDEETLNLANAIGKKRGQFKVGNQWRFQKKEQPEENALGLEFKNEQPKPLAPIKKITPINQEEVEQEEKPLDTVKQEIEDKEKGL